MLRCADWQIITDISNERSAFEKSVAISRHSVSYELG